MNWHKFASIALGVGSFAAAHFVPATLLIPGIGLPLGAVIAGIVAITAAVGIEPAQVSPGVADVLSKISIGKLGQAAAPAPDIK